MFSQDSFKGHRILVTGGGTGLGKAMGGRLLELGASLHICGRRQSVLDEAAAELAEQHGGQVVTHSVDVRDPQSVDAMIAEIWQNPGPLTGLINNAAGNFISRTEDLSSRGFDAIADTVFHGTFYVTHAVGKRWISGRARGSVVSIVTTWTRTGSPFVVPSAMSKAGIDAMTKSLAVEWGRYGIRLNAIAPGIFPTEGATARLRPGDKPHELEQAANPTRRLGKLSELANLSAFLLADGCEWLNGETIAIDGGHHLANGAYFTQYAEWTDEQWSNARSSIQAQTAKDKALRTTGSPSSEQTGD
jgi:NAD(P)-dependent dehydrogenase (short-subunit alcohol dehydrogenase family)